MASGNCLPVGCFFKDYNVFMTGPAGLDLTDVVATERIVNRRQVDLRPVCPWGPPEDKSAVLEKGPNGLFGVGDTLQIPGMSLSEACAHHEDQIVKVGACTVQTNLLKFEADNFGFRNITRSDER